MIPLEANLVVFDLLGFLYDIRDGLVVWAFHEYRFLIEDSDILCARNER